MIPARLRTAFVLAFALAACGGDQARPGVPPRHLLLITIEGLRADHVTSLGYERRTTTLLRPDRPVTLDLGHLADGGVVFAWAFAPSAHPGLSVAALLCGEVPVEGGRPRLVGALNAAGGTLAEDFSAAGFRTGAFVNAGSIDASQTNAEGLGRGFAEASFHPTDETALGAAVAWLKAGVPSGEPHFTWLHLGAIEPPFAETPLTDRFSPVDYAGRVRAEPAFFERLASEEFDLSAEDDRALADLYDGRVVRATELINSFLFLYKNSLGDEALWDDTLIALSGVTGCELAEVGGRVGVGDSLREEGLRVPLLLRHTKSLTGERIYEEVVTLPDLGATLRDWFQTSGREEGSGRSLLGLTDRGRAQPFEPRGALAVTPDGTGVSLRSPGWRLVVRGEAVSLYDLVADPLQLRDVGAAVPEVRAELLSELDQRLAEGGFAPRSQTARTP